MILGILGGNEAIIFLSEAAKKRNVEIIILDKDINCPASINSKIIRGNFNSETDLKDFYKKCNYLFVNTPKVNIELLKKLDIENKIFQELYIFNLLKTRLQQKALFNYFKIKNANAISVRNKEDFLLKKNLFNYPLVIKNNQFDHSEIDYQWMPKIDAIKDEEKVINYINQYENKHLIVEDYIKWIGQLVLSCFRNKKGENFICSYNWTIYYSNCLFIVQPNYVRKKILADTKQIVNTLLDKMNSPGIFTFKFFEEDKLKLVLNSVTPFFHNSGNQTLFNFKYSQYDYLLNIVLEQQFIQNEKIKNLAMVCVIGKKYNKKRIAEIVKDKRLNFYDFNQKYNKNINSICYGFFSSPRNPNNHDVLKKLINEFHSFGN